MKTDMQLTETRLEITRIFEAPRPLVWEAWVDPERAKKWSGCEEGTITAMTIDLRVGGEGRTTMLIPGAGGPLTAVATYTAVDPPKRLTYRLGWEPAVMEAPETVVNVEFEDLGDRTQVRLTQEGLMNPEMKANVSRGWRGSLDLLRETLATGDVELEFATQTVAAAS